MKPNQIEAVANQRPRARRTGALSRLTAFPLGTALALLLVGASLEQPAVDIGSVTIKPEHVTLVLVWVLAGWRLIAAGVLATARLLFWTIPFLLVLIAASLINSPDPVVSLRQAGMVALVTSASWLAFGFAVTRERLLLAVNLLIWLTTAEAAFIFVSLALAWIGVPLGSQPGRGGIAVPNGTLWEPNLLGSYLAAGGVLALAQLLSCVNRTQAIVLSGALTLALTALSLSLARGAWLGFTVGVLVLGLGYVCSWSSGRVWPQTMGRNVLLALVSAGLAVLFLTLVAPVLFPGTSKGLASRLNLDTYNPQSDPSVLARANSLQEALPGIQEHPVIGNGAGSFGLTYSDEKDNPGWIPNLFVHVLHDSGLVGLACWLAGIIGLAWAILRGRRKILPFSELSGDALPFGVYLGLVATVGAILVAFQVTEGSWLSFPWVYLGLLVAAIHLARGADQRPLKTVPRKA